MPAMTVGGLASGLDTNSIVSQLTALEQAKVTREEKKKAAAEDTLEKFKELESKLTALQTKAKGLELPKNFNVFKSSSSDEEYATVSGSEGGTTGQYDIIVGQLATNQKIASKSFAKINEPLNLSGKIAISTTAATQAADFTKKTVDIEIKASDTLKDVVNKINAAEGSGVKASLITLANGENRISLTAVDTGTQSFFLSEDSGNAVSILGSAGLGFLEDDADPIAMSGGAFVTKEGIANGSTALTDLSVAFGSVGANDDIGVKINGTWLSVKVGSKDIDTALDELAGKVRNELGLNASELNIKLSDSGEVVIEGTGLSEIDDLKEVKFQIGTIADGSTTDPTKVKVNLGSFSERNTFTSVTTKGQNSFYIVDDIAISSQSNNDDKTIVGTTFNLKKPSNGEAIRVSLELDKDALVDKIAEFITEYNDLMKFIEDNMRATIVEQKDENTGKKGNVRVTGPFTGDSNISGLRDSLKQMVTGIIHQISGVGQYEDLGFSTVYSSASRVGIMTEKDGTISVDKEKLGKALAADFDGVRRLFTSGGFSNDSGYSVGNFMKNSKAGTYEIKNYGAEVYFNGEPLEGYTITANILTTKEGLSIEMPPIGTGSPDAKVTFVRGIAGQLANFVEKAKDSVDGYFKQSKDTYENRIKEMEKRVDQLQRRVDSYVTRITKQFADLEKSMSNLQSQSSNMIAALSNLNNNSK